jgi:hypothetical protein
MKIRSEIGKKKRFAIMLLYSGFAVFLFLLLLSIRYEVLTYISFGGLAVILFAWAYAFYGIKCPKCKERWGFMAMYGGGFFSISKKIRFCPFCGCNVDTEF